MRALLVIALLSCGDNIDANGRSHGVEDDLAEWLTSEGATKGIVYTCDSGASCNTPEGEPATEEWCWDGREEDLEALLGIGADGCHPITAEERWFPWLVGCAYCPKTRGCNAHCGCAGCPPAEEEG
jgi:hypothetical protein